MTDEEIRALVDEFNRKVSLDPEIRSVMQKIRNQDVDFSDTSRMFWRRSELLRDYLQGIVLDLPAGAREQLCTALLNAGYNETNEVMQSVQQVQDEPQGIHLNPVLPKRPAERIHTVAHALEDPTVPDDKIVRRAGAPVANVQMSFHDRYIEENAKIRAKLGMKPTITRYGSGCCAWCSAVAGRYRFGEQPKDIFRRHDNCGCTIIYDNQVLRGRETSSGRSRAWEEVDPAEVMRNGFQPAVFSAEQSEALMGSSEIGFDKLNGSKAISKELAEEYRAEYDRFVDMFGSLKSLMGIDIAPYADNDVFGEYYPQSRRIVIYGAGGKDGNKFVTQSAQNHKSSGEWSTGSKYHSFRHELGHALQMEHSLTDPNWDKKIIEIENIRQNIVSDLTNPDGSANIEVMGSKLSKYGFKNTGEFISESIAEYFQNPQKARSTSKKVIEIIMRGDEYYADVNSG